MLVIQWLKNKYVAGVLAAILLIFVTSWVTCVVKDRSAAKREQALQVQVQKKESELKQQQQTTVEAEKRAAVADGLKVAAEKRYTATLSRIKELERVHPDFTPSVTDLPPGITDPCLEIREFYVAEHDAREACGEALNNANTEIVALNDANTSLHKEKDILIEKSDIQDKRLEVVTEQRDTQESRKKMWRTTALAAITAALALLL